MLKLKGYIYTHIYIPKKKKKSHLFIVLLWIMQLVSYYELLGLA